MPQRVGLEKRQQYKYLRFELGMNKADVCREIGVSRGWAYAFERDLPSNSSGNVHRAKFGAGGDGVPDKPVDREALKPEAARSLEEFGYFRFRYFGRLSSPWQEEAGHRAVELLASAQKEFLVVNCPPGSGKSTLFSHDLPAWLTARDRSIRGLIGSRTSRQAEAYTGRLRRSFERRFPQQAKDDDRAAGRAFDAEAALAPEFGTFKPENPDLWTRNAFVVAQTGGQPIDEKEPTWTAFGMDSGSLGWRVRFIDWDDLVDKTTIRTEEAIESQRSWWEDEGETRLEPDGLLLLNGQRLAATDLYRYCLDMVTGVEELDGEGDKDALPKKYHHIVYKAHYDDKCTEEHGKAAKPWPDGCLLDPVRLPWRELRAVKANRRAKFQVLYQQEDVDPDDVLVPRLWVDGGTGPDGVVYPGCYDRDRGLMELPEGLAGPLYSVVTADPSPTKYWSIQHWVYQEPTQLRWLMDLERRPMDAPDFLEWDSRTNRYTGLLEEWWLRANAAGVPFRWLIVEDNAAQRFLLQYQFFRQWAAQRKVAPIPHQTHRNKLDAEYGVQASLQPVWRHGQVRLPMRQLGRYQSGKLVDEVTRWPAGTDDCVMAQWFFEYHLQTIVAPDVSKMPKFWRPTWMARSA